MLWTDFRKLELNIELPFSTVQCPSLAFTLLWYSEPHLHNWDLCSASKASVWVLIRIYVCAQIWEARVWCRDVWLLSELSSHRDRCGVWDERRHRRLGGCRFLLWQENGEQLHNLSNISNCWNIIKFLHLVWDSTTYNYTILYFSDQITANVASNL